MTDQLEKIVNALVPIIQEIAELSGIDAIEIADGVSDRFYNEVVNNGE